MKKQFKTITAMCGIATALFLVSCNSSSNKENTTAKTEEHQHGEGDHHEHIYACPMHPDVTGKEGDKCSKCGMALEHMDEAPANGNFQMQFTSSPQTIEAGKAATLSFTPKNKDNAGAAVPLEVEHEKKIHLIMVSEDLSWFNHIHPEYQADGSYTVTETFPNGGNYILYADYKPSGGTHQVEKIAITVSGKSVPKISYSKDKVSATTNGITLNLIPEGGKFVTNATMHIQGKLTQNGKPLDANTLDNYLGAKAHMVVVGLNDKNYLHVHPEVENGSLDLHTTFEKTGIYRGWVQFQKDGKLNTADFVFIVAEGKAEDGHTHSHGDEMKDMKGMDEHKH
ncbi:MAG: hypothetical protein JNL95_08215 [Chitinophagales bacterium]|nr:hypothetical protein [Chitinophagales bacterium]